MKTKPAFYTGSPLDYAIEPGLTVGDLKTEGECNAALLRLEAERDSIMRQIAKDEEAAPADRRPGWRTKAGSALRWKKRIMAAIREHAATLRAPKDPSVSRSKIILDTIREELGPREFERLVDLAKASRPDVFGRGP